MGADHPIAWCREFAGGRAFYTAGVTRARAIPSRSSSRTWPAPFGGPRDSRPDIAGASDGRRHGSLRRGVRRRESW